MPPFLLMPSHFYIAAAHKSSGKTSLSIGLCTSLAARGLAVQPFKKGPDYIDPLWLSQAAGRDCVNLDFYTQSRQELDDCFGNAMFGADVGLIEGNKGLFDGLDLDGSNSNAALAKQLGSPVILVLDTQGMTRGVAPLILGYQAFDPQLNIAGVILNKVGGRRHEAKLRAVIEHYTDVPVIGAVQRSPDMHISERHLGLVPSNEAGESLAQIERMGRQVADQVDLQRLMDLSQPFEGQLDQKSTRAFAEPVRIGIARDSAFGFYYNDDLDALRAAGADLVFFSPLEDVELPNVDALIFGGGFPETHMSALQENQTLIEQIRRFVESDRAVYAECGGLMYLSRSLTWGAKQSRMAAVIPADVVMHERPQGRGYVRLKTTDAHPWMEAGREVAAHEFHYSALSHAPGLGGDIRYAFKVERGTGVDGQHDGIRYRNLLANYAHMRDTQSNRWASGFVNFVRTCRRQ